VRIFLRIRDEFCFVATSIWQVTDEKGDCKMRYVLSMIGDESAWLNQTPEEMQATIERVEAFNAELAEAGATRRPPT
jgi:hypothetical protein